MSAPQWTPGPWHVNAIDIRKGRIVGDETTSERFDKLTVNAQNRTVATVYHRANARLIAAAPELAEALREAYEALHDIINAAQGDAPYSAEELDRLFGDAAGKAFAALAKAEGRA